LATALLSEGVNHLHLTTPSQTTTEDSFYRETKWCAACATQVRYLASVNHSFCVQCGGKVHLFARDEQSRVVEAAQRHRYQAI
jgi:rRNA maturation endonuclease Nob1